MTGHRGAGQAELDEAAEEQELSFAACGNVAGSLRPVGRGRFELAGKDPVAPAGGSVAGGAKAEKEAVVGRHNVRVESNGLPAGDKLTARHRPL